MGFFLFQLVNLARDITLCSNLIEALCARAYPDLFRSRVLGIIAPSTALLSSVDPQSELIPEEGKRRRLLVENIEYTFIAIVLPVSFSVYLTTQLFRQSDPPFVGAIASLTGTLLIFAAVIWALIGMQKEPDFSMKDS